MKKILLLLLTAFVAIGAYADASQQKAPRKVSSAADLVGNYIWEYGGVSRVPQTLTGYTATPYTKEVSISLSETTPGGLTISGMYPYSLEAIFTYDFAGWVIRIARGQVAGNVSAYGDYLLEGSTPQVESGSIVDWPYEDVIGFVQEDGSIYFSCWLISVFSDDAGDYAGLWGSPIIVGGSSMTPYKKLVSVPEGAEINAYSLTYTDNDNKKQTVPAKVAVYGNEIYFQGISGFCPEAWVKGIKLGNTVTFPEKQYVGEHEDYGSIYAFSNCDAEYFYDEEAESYYTNGLVYGLAGDSHYDRYMKESLFQKIDEVPAMPANPTILDFFKNDDYGYLIQFDVPLEDQAGNPLYPWGLCFEIFTDIEGEVKPITFTPATHIKLHEDMTLIPYGFTDNWDFSWGNPNKYIFFNELYSPRWNKVGIKSIYTAGGITKETEIQWYDIKPYTWGTESDYRLPATTLYSYLISEQIYTPEDFGNACDITSISFFNTGAKYRRNLDVYLVYTDKETFDDGYDFVSFSETDKVFSGEVEFAGDEWTAIPFSKAFSYNGKDNVVLIVNDYTGYGFNTSLSCLVYDAPNQTLVDLNDEKKYTADNLVYGAIFNVKNQFRLNEVGLDTRPNPTNLTVSNLTWNSATITWEGEGDKWNLAYQKGYGNSAEWVEVNGLTEKSYELTGLEHNCAYFVHVQSDLGDGEVSGWTLTAFETPNRYVIVSDIKVLDATANTITLSWTDDNDATQWKFVLYGEEPHRITVDTNPYTVTGLVPETEYQIRISPYFEDDGEGPWVMFYASTNKLDNPAPYNMAVSEAPTSANISWEGMSDNYVVYYKKNVPDAGAVFFEDFEDGLDAKGWTVYGLMNVPKQGGWFTLKTKECDFDVSVDRDAHSGEYAASAWSRTSSPSYSYYADNWLITPQLDLQGMLTFWQTVDGSYLDYFEVLLSTTGNAVEDFTTVLRPKQMGTGEWQEVCIDLSRYEGKKGYIAIHHKGYQNHYLFIDDFGIYEGNDLSTIETTGKNASLTGLEPEAEYWFTVKGVKAGKKDAVSFSNIFTTPPRNPIPYDITIVPQTYSANIIWKGFSDTYIVQYKASGTDSWLTSWATDTKLTIENLQKNTSYDVQIHGLKSGETEAVSEVITFQTQYMDAIELVLYDNGDNRSLINVNNWKICDVTIKNRIFKKDGSWQPLCLPFNLDVPGSVLDGADVRALTSINVRSGVAIINFLTPVTKIQAGKSYLIRWQGGTNIVNPQFKGVEMLANADREYRRGQMTFLGHYDYNMYMEDNDEYDFYMTGDPILSPIEVGSVVHAFEFTVYRNRYSVVEINTVVMYTGEEEDIVVGVDPLGENEEETVIYNLAGQRLQELQKGINIVNGKKILVK